MTGRRARGSLALAAVGVLAALAGCHARAVPGARHVLPPTPCEAAPDLQPARFAWSDGVADLAHVEVRSLFGRGHRLVLDVAGGDGTATSFVVDTGSSGSTVSRSAPLAREVRLSPGQRFRIGQGRPEEGDVGVLPRVRMGTTEARDLAIGVVDRAHSLRDPRNLLGIHHLWSTQLEHAGGSWRLRAGTSRLPPTEPGWTVVAIERGVPVLRVLRPDGREAFGLIDTGAPRSRTVAGHPSGGYRIVDADRRTVLEIDARGTVDWPGLRVGERSIAVLVGLADLARRDWRLTFDRATWAFAPR